MVVLYTLTLSKGQGVVAVRENDGEQLVLIVHQVAAMDVSDGNLVLMPKFFTNKILLLLIILCIFIATYLSISLETILLHFSMKSL